MPVEQLETAESQYGRHPMRGTPLERLARDGVVPPAALVFRYWNGGDPGLVARREPTAFLPDGVDLGAALLSPRVYRGMWIVDCVCGGAQLVSKADPRFFCVDCLNGGSRLWRRVDWPAGHEQVEAALLARPNVASRNWQGEPVEQLHAENTARGLPSEVGR